MFDERAGSGTVLYVRDPEEELTAAGPPAKIKRTPILGPMWKWSMPTGSVAPATTPAWIYESARLKSDLDGLLGGADAGADMHQQGTQHIPD